MGRSVGARFANQGRRGGRREWPVVAGSVGLHRARSPRRFRATRCRRGRRQHERREPPVRRHASRTTCHSRHWGQPVPRRPRRAGAFRLHREGADGRLRSDVAAPRPPRSCALVMRQSGRALRGSARVELSRRSGVIGGSAGADDRHSMTLARVIFGRGTRMVPAHDACRVDAQDSSGGWSRSAMRAAARRSSP